MVLVFITKKHPKTVQVVKATRIFLKDGKLDVYKDVALTHNIKVEDLIDIQFVE